MKKAQTIHLTNALGTKLAMTNVGASIMSLHLNDAKGRPVNVIAGLKDAAGYANPDYQNSLICLGATIGRYAGRISNGGFTLDGIKYNLKNEVGEHLHGGSQGFQNQIWEVVSLKEQSLSKAVFKLESREGSHGYPGNLIVFARYELSDNNELIIEYTATTDKKTVVNLTNHAYFNLNGRGSIADHQMQINADQILETDAHLIPTGNFLEVLDAAFDYRQQKHLNESDFRGFDTVFVINDQQPQVVLKSPETGIQMAITTNQNAVVVFTPKNFDGIDLAQHNNHTFPAICFEAQNFPDAPNQPDFPSTVLSPGETYRNRTVYQFDID